MKTVQITWMDGEQHVFQCAEVVRGSDGVLALHPPRYPDTGEPARYFPVVNIRTWSES
jgi:hypothetical protein